MAVIIAILAFSTVFCLFLGVARQVQEFRATALAGVAASNALMDSPVGGMIRALAYLNDRPLFANYAAGIERKLLEAGKPGGYIIGIEFLAAAQLCGLAAALMVLGLFALAGVFSLFVLFFALVIGGFSLWIPHVWLDNAVSERQRQIQRQFPFFLDLAVMTMEAGSSLLETMEIYQRDNPDDALAEEIRILIGEVNMGKTQVEGIEGFRDRVAIGDVKNAANALIQANQMGTPIGQVIRDQSDVMRFKRSQNAERMAEVIKVRIQGPTMLMMMSVFLLILGPAFIRVMRSGIF
jgi:tight adherence protein C